MATVNSILPVHLQERKRNFTRYCGSPTNGKDDCISVICTVILSPTVYCAVCSRRHQLPRSLLPTASVIAKSAPGSFSFCEVCSRQLQLLRSLLPTASVTAKSAPDSISYCKVCSRQHQLLRSLLTTASVTAKSAPDSISYCEVCSKQPQVLQIPPTAHRRINLHTLNRKHHGNFPAFLSQ
jgi:hypothetical protein